MSESILVPIESLRTARSREADPEVTIYGLPLDKLSGGEVKLPLVSLIVINHNYEAYVGKAIESIRCQDYPNFEVVVIDNASTDYSAEVIVASIDGNPRFKFIRAQQNDFAMGAALRGLEVTTGQFVCFVDADDFLFSNFVSTHVQVHLALPRSVAFTSSNVVEIAADGAMLAGGRKNVPPANPDKFGLRTADIVPRLAMISDEDFERLGREVVTWSQTKRGWLWSTGTANFYRRSVIEFARPPASDADIAIMSADGYFARFAHWLGGSAVIGRPLSAYRIHGANLFATGPSMIGLASGTGPAHSRLTQRRRYLLRQVLARAGDIEDRTAPSRFWGILDQALDALRGSIHEEFQEHAVQSIFVEHFPGLVERFGLRVTNIELRRRIPRRHLWRILARALPEQSLGVHALHLEAELRLWLWRLTGRK